MLLLTPMLLQASALGLAGAAIGAGIVALAAGFGISRLGQATMEASARQPEIAGGLRTTAIIIGALIEGVCLFAVLVCLLALFQ